MEELKKILKDLTSAQLLSVVQYIFGLIDGRPDPAAANPASPKPPRKHSTCSICHQSGHRAPNCPQKGQAA